MLLHGAHCSKNYHVNLDYHVIAVQDQGMYNQSSNTQVRANKPSRLTRQFTVVTEIHDRRSNKIYNSKLTMIKKIRNQVQG